MANQTVCWFDVVAATTSKQRHNILLVLLSFILTSTTCFCQGTEEAAKKTAVPNWIVAATSPAKPNGDSFFAHWACFSKDDVDQHQDLKMSRQSCCQEIYRVTSTVASLCWKLPSDNCIKNPDKARFLQVCTQYLAQVPPYVHPDEESHITPARWSLVFGKHSETKAFPPVAAWSQYSTDDNRWSYNVADPFRLAKESEDESDDNNSLQARVATKIYQGSVEFALQFSVTHPEFSTSGTSQGSGKLLNATLTVLVTLSDGVVISKQRKIICESKVSSCSVQIGNEHDDTNKIYNRDSWRQRVVAMSVNMNGSIEENDIAFLSLVIPLDVDDESDLKVLSSPVLVWSDVMVGDRHFSLVPHFKQRYGTPLVLLADEDADEL